MARRVIRWTIVVGLLLGTWFLLAPIRHFAATTAATDEILAYELRRSGPLRARVPAGIEEIFITTWALVTEEEEWDPARQYTYSYQVRYVGGKPGKADDWTRELGVTTRVSGDPSSPLSEGKFAARTPVAGPWVTDSRTSVFGVDGSRGGVLTIRVPQPAAGVRVLTRILYPEPRGRLERLLVERSLSAGRRERLTSGMASLGFNDLPAEARSQAVSTWGRRLVAEGREGADYFTQRLLLGDYRLSAAELAPRDAPFVVGPGKKVVLNFENRAPIRLHGPIGKTIILTEVPGATRVLTVGPSGYAQAEVGVDGQTVSVQLETESEQELRASIDAAHWSAPLGDTRQHLRTDGRLALVPDTSILSYSRLDPERPLVFSLDPKMPHIKLEARVIAEELAPSKSRELALELSWTDEDARQTSRRVQLSPPPPVSSYERLEETGIGVTEARSVRLRVEPHMNALQVRGSPHVLARAWTEEPGVLEKEFQPPYGQTVPEGYELRFAPHLRTTWAHLRPQDHERLAKQDRAARVVSQVRLEAVDIGARLIDPRAVELSGTLRWFDLPEIARPRSLWRRASESDPVRIRSDDGELECVYWFDTPMLGRKVSVRLGDETVERLVSFAMGRWRFEVPPGVNGVQLQGHDDPHVFICRTDPPALGGPLLIRRRVARLRTGSSITIDRSSGELLSVLVFVASEDGPPPSYVNYRVDAGEQDLPDVFSHRLTDFDGMAVHEHLEYGRLWISPASPDPELSTAMARYRIRLGDDLAPGRHTISLSPPPNTDSSLWFRAVVVGVQLPESNKLINP